MKAVLTRLIYEGAMNYMSAKDMAAEIGLSPRTMTPDPAQDVLERSSV